jgi:segregation and condensation protein B
MTEEEKDYVEISPSSSEIIEDIEEQPIDEQVLDEEALDEEAFGGEVAEEETEITNTEAVSDIEEQSDVPEIDSDIEITVESVVEAVLFASDEPLTAERLANIVETSVKQIRQHIQNLNEKYKANANAFTIEQIAGGYQMLTLSPYNNWLRKLLRTRSDSKLSAAALETLAIISYKQPVIRADIEAIRGVAAGDMIRSLMYKGLVKIVGRAEVLGRPMLYGTTKKFLEIFGLNSLKDLPKIEELRKPPE